MTAPLRHSDPITVDVERAYDIVIGRDVLQTLGSRIAALRPGVRTAIVTDRTVAKHWLEKAEASLAQAGIAASRIIVDEGEGSKSYAGLAQVSEALIAAKIERNDLVIALGGGVVGDLAGFAAAILRRGVDFVQVPTSLLAQVDSSVGGKTGINSPQGKNLLGAFHQPILVIADTTVLDTLSPRQFRAGYAEVAKYGVLGDQAFFGWLEANHADIFSGAAAREHAIATSCRAKAAIVARDERETGERALLNLGHTFGHALEAATGFSDRLFHGEGVAVGMVLAAEFSAQLGMISQTDAARVELLLAPRLLAGIRRASLPTRASVRPVVFCDVTVKCDCFEFVSARAAEPSSSTHARSIRSTHVPAAPRRAEEPSSNRAAAMTFAATIDMPLLLATHAE